MKQLFAGTKILSKLAPRNALSTILLVIALFCAVFVASNNVNDIINKRSIDQMMSAVRQGARDVNVMISSTEQQMAIMADMLSALYPFTDADIQNHLYQQQPGMLLSAYSVLFPDNHMVYAKDKPHLIGIKSNFIYEKERGTSFYSRHRGIPYQYGQYSIFTYPIKVNNEVKAILFGYVNLRDLLDKLQVSHFADQAALYIISGKTGDMLVDTWHPGPLGNILDTTMRNRVSVEGKPFTKIITDIDAEQEGYGSFISLTIDEPLILSYAPVGRYKMSFMISLPGPIVFADALIIKHINHLLAISMMVATLIYIVFILQQAYRKSKRAAARTALSIAITKAQTVLLQAYENSGRVNESLALLAKDLNATHIILVICQKELIREIYSSTPLSPKLLEHYLNTQVSRKILPGATAIASLSNSKEDEESEHELISASEAQASKQSTMHTSKHSTSQAASRATSHAAATATSRAKSRASSHRKSGRESMARLSEGSSNASVIVTKYMQESWHISNYFGLTDPAQEIKHIVVTRSNDPDSDIMGIIYAFNVNDPELSCEGLESLVLSFCQAVKSVSDYKDLQGRGELDALTGLKNRSAYQRDLMLYDEQSYCARPDKSQSDTEAAPTATNTNQTAVAIDSAATFASVVGSPLPLPRESIKQDQQDATVNQADATANQAAATATTAEVKAIAAEAKASASEAKASAAEAKSTNETSDANAANAASTLLLASSGEIFNENLTDDVVPGLWGCIYIDVNGLHDLNNTCGHNSGDIMLKTIARLIRKTFGYESTYRIGGDEFVVISQGRTALEIASTLHEMQIVLDSDNYHISSGYALVQKDEHIHQTLVKAEAMMYVNKKAYYESGGAKRSARKRNEEIESVLKEKHDHDSFLQVISHYFLAAYLVDLNYDRPRIIYPPQNPKIVLKEDESHQVFLRHYSQLFFTGEAQERFLAITNYDKIQESLDQGHALEYNFTRNDGKSLHLRILPSPKYSATNCDTIWIYERSDAAATTAANAAALVMAVATARTNANHSASSQASASATTQASPSSTASTGASASSTANT